METEYIKVDRDRPDPQVICRGAELLCRGEVVAFPTETVYGLGANALDPSAVRKIFQAKGRPSDNPLIVHIAAFDELEPLVSVIPPAARVLMQAFWPGPLTMIFPKSDIVPLEVTAGLDTVAVRMPSHPVARALIREAHVPVAAPSANVSGRPSPTTGLHVWQDLCGKVSMVIDGGETKVGVESTVLDLSRLPLTVLRPGGVTTEELERLIGPVSVDRGQGKLKIPRAPGMKYTHYAPKAPVTIVSGERMAETFISCCREGQAAGKKVALLLSKETAEAIGPSLQADYLEILGSRQDPASVAHNLFSSFRNADSHGADMIFIEEFSESGMGLAVMNRMRKAAGGKVIKGRDME